MEKSFNGILGLVVGDSISLPAKSQKREKLLLNPITEMQENTTLKLPKGIWGCQSSLTLATLDSISKEKKIDFYSIEKNYIDWYKETKYTSNGKIFDVNESIVNALEKYIKKGTNPVDCGENSESSNSNTTMARLISLAYYFQYNFDSEDEIFKCVRDFTKIINANMVSVMANFIFVLFTMQLLNKESILDAYSYVKKYKYKKYFNRNTIIKFNRILRQNIYLFPLNQIYSNGYVVNNLEAIIWILINTKSFNEAVIGAVNLGEKCNDIAACVGALASICYGSENIRESWVSDINNLSLVKDICDKFDLKISHNVVVNSENNNSYQSHIDTDNLMDDIDSLENNQNTENAEEKAGFFNFTKKNKINELKNQNEELKKNIEDKNIEFENLKNEKKINEETISDEIDNLKNVNDNLINSLHKKKQELEQASVEKEEHVKNMAELRGTNELLIAKLTEKKAELEKIIEEKEKNELEINKEISNLKDAKNELVEKLENQRNELNQVKEEKINSEKNISSQLDKLNDLNNKLKSDLDLKTQEIDNIKNDFNNKIEQVISENDELKKKIEKFSNFDFDKIMEVINSKKEEIDKIIENNNISNNDNINIKINSKENIVIENKKENSNENLELSEEIQNEILNDDVNILQNLNSLNKDNIIIENEENDTLKNSTLTIEEIDSIKKEIDELQKSRKTKKNKQKLTKLKNKLKENGVFDFNLDKENIDDSDNVENKSEKIEKEVSDNKEKVEAEELEENFQEIDESNVKNDEDEYKDYKKIEDLEIKKIKNIRFKDIASNTLIISEPENLVLLPVDKNAVLMNFKQLNKLDNYEDIDNYIRENYLFPLSSLKNNFSCKMKEVLDLMKRSNTLSFSKGKYLFKMLFKSNIQTPIIAACSNTEELDQYMKALKNNDLTSFKIFNIEYIGTLEK